MATESMAMYAEDPAAPIEIQGDAIPVVVGSDKLNPQVTAVH